MDDDFMTRAKQALREGGAVTITSFSHPVGPNPAVVRELAAARADRPRRGERTGTVHAPDGQEQFGFIVTREQVMELRDAGAVDDTHDYDGDEAKAKAAGEEADRRRAVARWFPLKPPGHR